MFILVKPSVLRLIVAPFSMVMTACSVAALIRVKLTTLGPVVVSGGGVVVVSGGGVVVVSGGGTVVVSGGGIVVVSVGGVVVVSVGGGVVVVSVGGGVVVSGEDVPSLAITPTNCSGEVLSSVARMTTSEL